MAIVTIVGAGMMGSALAFPARENGHTVRIVGTHLDREIIDECLQNNKHPKFDIPFPKGIEFFQIEELEKALVGANVVIGGVSSFGVDWFADKVLPVIPETAVVLTVTKGLIDTPDGKLFTYPSFWKEKLKSINKSLSLNAIGGPCTSYELVKRLEYKKLNSQYFFGPEKAIAILKRNNANGLLPYKYHDRRRRN